MPTWARWVVEAYAASAALYLVAVLVVRRLGRRRG
jgi:hypothetical protein